MCELKNIKNSPSRRENRLEILQIAKFLYRPFIFADSVYSHARARGCDGKTSPHIRPITRHRNPRSGVSGSDRRTDISANTRLLAPIVPLYTTEIPSKMQEDTGVEGKGGIRNTEGRSTTPLGGIPGYVLNCCIPNLLVYVCYRVSYSCAAAKESARPPNFMCTVPT